MELAPGELVEVPRAGRRSFLWVWGQQTVACPWQRVATGLSRGLITVSREATDCRQRHLLYVIDTAQTWLKELVSSEHGFGMSLVFYKCAFSG